MKEKKSIFTRIFKSFKMKHKKEQELEVNPVYKQKIEQRTRKSTFDLAKPAKEIFASVASSCGFKDGWVPKGLIYSNKGAQERKPICDVSYGCHDNIFAYWEDKKEEILCISYKYPGYEIKAHSNMFKEFSNFHNLRYLDVTHLDVSEVYDFSDCFRNFGMHPGSRIVGLNCWNVSKATVFRNMFKNAFPNNEEVVLDIAMWKFREGDQIILDGMFENFAKTAGSVELYMNCWDFSRVVSSKRMFKSFAPEAEIIELEGPEFWNMGSILACDEMFCDFAQSGDYVLDLSRWNEISVCEHKNFKKRTKGKIKEPTWMR